MNGDQGQVRIAIQDTVRRPLAQESLEDGKAFTGPAQLQSEEYRQHNGYNAHHNGGHQELLGDHLVIVRENVLRDEAFFVMMCVCSHD